MANINELFTEAEQEALTEFINATTRQFITDHGTRALEGNAKVLVTEDGGSEIKASAITLEAEGKGSRRIEPLSDVIGPPA